MPRCLWYKMWVGLHSCCHPGLPGAIVALLQQQHCSAAGEVWVTSKALLMSFCLQISDDGRPWQLSSEEGSTVQVLWFLILTSPYPAFPEQQMSSKRPQVFQLLSALTILSKFWSSTTPVVYLSMMDGNTDECWISHCREPERTMQNNLTAH